MLGCGLFLCCGRGQQVRIDALSLRANGKPEAYYSVVVMSIVPRSSGQFDEKKRHVAVVEISGERACSHSAIAVVVWNVIGGIFLRKSHIAVDNGPSCLERCNV